MASCFTQSKSKVLALAFKALTDLTSYIVLSLCHSVLSPVAFLKCQPYVHLRAFADTAVPTAWNILPSDICIVYFFLSFRNAVCSPVFYQNILPKIICRTPLTSLCFIPGCLPISDIKFHIYLFVFLLAIIILLIDFSFWSPCTKM